MNYFEENCCFCVKELESPIQINDFDEDNITYINKLKLIFQDLNIPEENCLPNSICLMCCENLKQTYEFKQQCIKSLNYWSELGNPDIKPEFIDLKPEIDPLSVIQNEDISSNSKLTKCEEQESKDAGSSESYNEVQDECNEENYLDTNEHEPELKTEIIFDQNSSSNNENSESCLEVPNHFIYSKNSNRLELTCQICNKIFPDKARLTTHMKFHSDDRRYECNKCGKKFLQLSGLNNHLLVHSDEKNYECDICNRKFKSTAYLNAHLKQHSDTYEKPTYKCDLCSKTFKSKSGIYFHKKCHSSEQKEKKYTKTFSYDSTELPYPCTVCHKSFIEKNRLVKHMKFHSNNRPHVCDICGKSFVQSSGLKNHLSTHSDDKNFECSYCNKRFKNQGSLVTHVDIHLDRVHQCNICDKTFKKLTSYYSHRTTHRKPKNRPSYCKSAPIGPKFPFPCDVCPKSFMDQARLNKHMKFHSNHRPYVCQICGKDFVQLCGLKAHLFVHTDEKNYECSTCKKRFKTDLSLKIHRENIQCKPPID